MELLATLEPFARRHHLIQHCTLEGGDVYRSLHGYCCSSLWGLHHLSHDSFWKSGCRVSIPLGHSLVLTQARGPVEEGRVFTPWRTRPLLVTRKITSGRSSIPSTISIMSCSRSATNATKIRRSGSTI